VTNTPIYDQVCEDLKVYPRALKRRDHRSFMREHEQTEWLYQAQARVYTGELPANRRLRAVRKPRKR
jgi:hypothetical protein